MRLILEGVVDAPVEVGFIEAEFVDDAGGVLPVDPRFHAGDFSLTLDNAPICHVTLINAPRKP